MVSGNKRVSIAVAIILAMAIAISVSGCGLGGDPASVVSTFFDAIDNQDVKKFLGCFEEDFANQFGSLASGYLEEMIRETDESLTDEYGKNWRRLVRIGKAKKGDTIDDITYYSVEVEFDGDENTFGVKKVNGRFYLDEKNMSGSLW